MTIEESATTNPPPSVTAIARNASRLEFWRSVADVFGVDVDIVDRRLAASDPAIVVDRLLPGRSSEEHSEVLWALGEFERRSHADRRAATAKGCTEGCEPAA